MKKNNWFNKKIEEVEKDLNTNLEKGLTTEEVKKGKNNMDIIN